MGGAQVIAAAFESRNWRPYEDVSTRYVTLKAADGSLTDSTAETLLDLPTHQAVAGCGEISGDMIAFKAAHQGGREAAQRYLLTHMENPTPTGRCDPAETERRRHHIMREIEALCQRPRSQ